MGRLLYFVAEAWRGLWHHRTLTFTALVSLVGGLLVLGIFLALTSNAEHALSALGDRREIVVYLRDSATEAEKNALVARMDSLYGHATYVTRGQAWEEFARELGGTELLEAVGQNPLPASIRLSLRPELLNFDAMERTADALSSEPAVEEVRFGGEWVRRLDQFIATLTFLDLVVGAIVALAVLFVVGNTIRLTMVARQDILRVMALVGAGDAFIRLPLILEGLIEAVLGALIALGILYGGLAYLDGRPVDLAPLPLAWAGAFVGFAALLGTLGSYVALFPLTRKH